MLCLALFCSNRDNVTSLVWAVYSAGPTDRRLYIPWAFGSPVLIGWKSKCPAPMSFNASPFQLVLPCQKRSTVSLYCRCVCINTGVGEEKEERVMQCKRESHVASIFRLSLHVQSSQFSLCTSICFKRWKIRKRERKKERKKNDKMAWAHHGIQHKALELHPVISDDMA